MLSDTLRLVAAELKLHRATGACFDAETITVFYSVIKRVANEIDAAPQLTPEPLSSGKVVMFTVTQRPAAGGTA